jgi:probable F420-dependent oxidoreductase
VHRFRFGLAATTLAGSGAVAELARRAEGGGFATLLTADHLGPMSPFPPLLAAAGVTSDLRVGTFVINNELHHPLRLAQDAASIDLLTDGRFELGVGSGWNKAEFDAMDLAYDRPSVRAGRLAESISTVKRAWSGEPTVSVSGVELPAVPRPAQDPLPLLIGGHSDAVLRLAAQEAQIVGFTGLTWSNGSLVPSGAAARAIAERVRFVRDAAGPRADALELNVLVQVCEMGDGAEQALDSLVERFGIERRVLDESPLVLAGSAAQVKDKLQSLREEIGLSYFVVFDRALDPMTEVVAALAGT